MRSDIDERKNEIEEWLRSGVSQRECAKRLNCKIETLKTRLDKWNLSHLSNQAGLGYRKPSVRSVALEEYFKGKPISSHKLKLRLLAEGYKEVKCEKCGWCEWSEDGRLPLELDHIDNDHYNNAFENLQVLCPNCHALKAPNSFRKDLTKRRNEQYLLDRIKAKATPDGVTGSRA